MPVDPGVPVAQYLDQKLCEGVVFHCQRCARRHTVSFDVLIPRLLAMGADPERLGIRHVYLYARRPCEECGGLAFETRPAWMGRPGSDGTAA
jgi:hypothetical protein